LRVNCGLAYSSYSN